MTQLSGRRMHVSRAEGRGSELEVMIRYEGKSSAVRPGRLAAKGMERPSRPQTPKLVREPTPTARHYFAKALLAEEQHAAALRIARDLPSSSTRHGLSFGYQTQGMAFADLGMPRDACVSYREAVELDAPRAVPVLAWVRFAIVVQDRRELMHALEVARGVEVPDAVLQAARETWSNPALMPQCRPDPAAGRWVERSDPQQDEPIRRIVDACL